MTSCSVGHGVGFQINKNFFPTLNSLNPSGITVGPRQLFLACPREVNDPKRTNKSSMSVGRVFCIGGTWYAPSDPKIVLQSSGQSKSFSITTFNHMSVPDKVKDGWQVSHLLFPHGRSAFGIAGVISPVPLPTVLACHLRHAAAVVITSLLESDRLPSTLRVLCQDNVCAFR